MSNYAKLKTNLKLAIQRLKLLEKKKTELSLKSRKEIADYLGINKVDRARIRVEHIIREDNYVEAMEMLEMFCDMLLARFGLIEKMKELDPGLDESIATIIWSSPRISSDILEFKTIAEILTHKYGRKYAEACKADSINNVNEKVKRRLGLEAPPKLLVEQYLIEIAKNFNVDYTPDNQIMLASGQMSEELIQLRDTVNDITKRNNNNNNNNNGGAGGPGAEAAYYPLPTQNIVSPPQEPYYPPTQPAPYHMPAPIASAYPNETKSVPIGFDETLDTENASPLPNKNSNLYNEDNHHYENQPSFSNKNPNDSRFQNEFHQTPPPSYNTPSNQAPDRNQNMYSPHGYSHNKDNEEDELILPSVPESNFNQAPDPNASIEFDDLAKRFENLKSFNKK